jgi:hypothetical protein
MIEHTVTKKDLYHVAHAYPRYHKGIIFQELVEVFEDGITYTLYDLLAIRGNDVYAEAPAIYISEKEYNASTPEWRENRISKGYLKRVGDKYEFLPHRVFKYERWITPLFYTAVVCRGVKDKRIIQMVADKIIYEDYDTDDKLFKKPVAWYGATEKQEQDATYLYNYYLRIKVGME